VCVGEGGGKGEGWDTEAAPHTLWEERAARLREGLCISFVTLACHP
jgi:hypothetical protein